MAAAAVPRFTVRGSRIARKNPQSRLQIMVAQHLKTSPVCTRHKRGALAFEIFNGPAAAAVYVTNKTRTYYLYTYKRIKLGKLVGSFGGFFFFLVFVSVESCFENLRTRFSLFFYSSKQSKAGPLGTKSSAVFSESHHFCSFYLI